MTGWVLSVLYWEHQARHLSQSLKLINNPEQCKRDTNGAEYPPEELLFSPMATHRQAMVKPSWLIENKSTKVPKKAEKRIRKRHNRRGTLGSGTCTHAQDSKLM